MQALFTKIGFTFPANVNMHKVLRTAVISSLIFLCFGLALFVVSVKLFSPKGASNKIASASMNSLSAAPLAANKNLTAGVNIADNGFVLVRSAKVVSISAGKLIKVATVWGNTNFDWAVQVSDTTKFLNANGNKETLAGVSVGSLITITGKLADGGGNEPLINAQFIRILQ